MQQETIHAEGNDITTSLQKQMSGQQPVTNDADPAAREKEAKEKSYYKNDLPDEEANEARPTNIDTDTEGEKRDVKEDYKDENIAVEPVLDNDGNEIGGQG